MSPLGAFAPFGQGLAPKLAVPETLWKSLSRDHSDQWGKPSRIDSSAARTSIPGSVVMAASYRVGKLAQSPAFLTW